LVSTSCENKGVEDRNMPVKDIKMLEKSEVKLNFTEEGGSNGLWGLC
jgi:hypothetical protein